MKLIHSSWTELECWRKKKIEKVATFLSASSLTFEQVSYFWSTFLAKLKSNSRLDRVNNIQEMKFQLAILFVAFAKLYPPKGKTWFIPKHPAFEWPIL